MYVAEEQRFIGHISLGISLVQGIIAEREARQWIVQRGVEI